jgi:hypothetical protein
MIDDARDFVNLCDYLTRARHKQLCSFAAALALEVNYRGLPCSEAAFELARALGRSASTPRAEPFIRPSISERLDPSDR